MNSKLLFFIVIPLILPAACDSRTFSLSPKPTAVIESLPTQIPVAAPTEMLLPLGEVSVYRDTHAGLELDSPSAWQLENNAVQDVAESVAYTSNLFSWDRASYTSNPRDLNTLRAGATRINITVFNQDPSSLLKAVDQFTNQDNGAAISFLKEPFFQQPSTHMLKEHDIYPDRI